MSRRTCWWKRVLGFCGACSVMALGDGSIAQKATAQEIVGYDFDRADEIEVRRREATAWTGVSGLNRVVPAKTISWAASSNYGAANAVAVGYGYGLSRAQALAESGVCPAAVRGAMGLPAMGATGWGGYSLAPRPAQQPVVRKVEPTVPTPTPAPRCACGSPHCCGQTHVYIITIPQPGHSGCGHCGHGASGHCCHHGATASPAPVIPPQLELQTQPAPAPIPQSTR